MDAQARIAPTPGVDPFDGSHAPPGTVRAAVRNLLLSAASFHGLDPIQRREVAQATVKVCQTAVALLREEAESAKMIAEISPAPQAMAVDVRRPALAQALNAGQQYSGVSAERVAGTTRAILNAVSFPRFVTELINGVFKSLVDTNQQQMNSYVELIKNVAAATDDFADANMGADRARHWLVERFPGSFEVDTGGGEDSDPRDREDDRVEAQLRLKDGASMPPEGALRTALGLAPDESIPSGDPESTLLPFARRALAQQRQQMLATMVMMGMQRIVIESGRINAAMRFHIDTRSAAASDEGSTFNFQNQTEASGKFGFGPWGLEAKMTNTIGYVSTQRNQSTEEMNTDLDLNSSVELYFKTDYLPLDRLAGKGQVDRIKVNTLNPDAEEKAAQEARTARETSAVRAEAERRSGLDKALTPTPSVSTAPAPAPTADRTGGARTPAPRSRTAPTPAPGNVNARARNSANSNAPDSTQPAGAGASTGSAGAHAQS